MSTCMPDPHSPPTTPHQGTPDSQSEMDGKWRKFIEFSCPNKSHTLNLYNIYTTDQLNPPPTPDPYSPPTTPQPPCKFHNPNVKRFPVHTSLSHLSTLQLSVTRLAPIGPVMVGLRKGGDRGELQDLFSNKSNLQ